jgi:uncharacterized membrane-anchored protein
MTTTALPLRERTTTSRQMLNKVPEITLYFWIIKVLCTTVGETGADNLDEKFNLGLTNLTYITGAVLAVALVFQFRLRQYVPPVYWLAVVLISVVGTLFSDNLVDGYGISLTTTTPIFAVILAVVFGIWYWSERTLSIHTIVTTKREAFYWLAVLFTFALGTSAGDLVAEKFAIGYFPSVLIFGGAIALVAFAHFRFRLNAVLAFWIAYILTRPLGASIGDWMSQPSENGGLNLGTTTTSYIFLGTILALVVFLTITRKDRIEGPEAELRFTADDPTARSVLVVANKTAATPTLLDAVRRRALAGPARFTLLIPNPDHVVFDRNTRDVRLGEQILGLALPLLETAAGSPVRGSVATSPNAYDDIVAALEGGGYDEVILSTLPTHLSHWLHLDLPRRVADLGYPVTTVTPRGAHAAEPDVPTPASA